MMPNPSQAADLTTMIIRWVGVTLLDLHSFKGGKTGNQDQKKDAL